MRVRYDGVTIPNSVLIWLRFPCRHLFVFFAFGVEQ